MLIAIGLDTDPTITHFVRAAYPMCPDLEFLNLRSLVKGSWEIYVQPDLTSHFVTEGRLLTVSPDDAIYCRLIDLSAVIRPQAMRKRWRMLFGALPAWLEGRRGIVINRPGHALDNGSKPFHEHRLRQTGFLVPDSFLSSNKSALADFCKGGPTIAKSVAGVRADTREVVSGDFDDFVPRQGPVHLQRRIFGLDARLHVVGGDVQAELIRSDAVDYRTSEARFETFTPPDDIVRAVVATTQSFGLEFAGWDFKIDEKGQFWCLEANPMPGYDSYDRRSGGAITNSLVERLRCRPQ
jgi:hypothetical protein